MTRIYVYPDNDNSDLPEEDVWLEEDHVVSSMEHKKKWNKEHGLPDEYSEEDNRNFEEYWCTPWDGTDWENDKRNTPYKRVRFERRYTLKYYEMDLEDFLREHPDWDIRFHRGHIFLRDWME